MTDERLWSKLNPLLEEKFELIHVPIPLTTNFEDAIKELDIIFKEEKINLLGFSLGSYLASYYAIKYPTKIDKLFLLAGSASFIDKDEVEKRKTVLKQMEQFGFKGLSTKKVLTLIEEKNSTNNSLIELIKDMYKDLGFEVYKSQMELSFTRIDIVNELTSLELPIKLFFSTKDRLFNYQSLEKIAEKNKENIELVSRVGTSHMIPLEDPITLSKEVIKWLVE